MFSYTILKLVGTMNDIIFKYMELWESRISQSSEDPILREKLRFAFVISLYDLISILSTKDSLDDQ